MTILLITNTDDRWSSNRVAEELRDANAEFVRIDTDLFPTAHRLVAWHDDGDYRTRGMLRIDDRLIDLSMATAVWHRRWYTAGRLSSQLSGEILRGAERESEMSLEGVIAALHCFHLDDPSAVERARNRSLQIECATAAGLETPRTLTTNDPQAALRFYDQCNGDVVVKMLSSFGVRDADGCDQVVMTNRVEREHLATIESLALCPMTFQERIEKALELRVTIVGHDVFAAAIDSSQVPDAAIDWRRASDSLRRHWQPYVLPSQIRDALVDVLDRLELNYGAIDVIVTPEQRFVFLEVNPVGQFGWIEQCVGYPIANSIAGLLTGRSGRRVDLPRRSILQTQFYED
jgi:glutathione synthase/RimK-type ligase-like ATP-grasp enzyme